MAANTANAVKAYIEGLGLGVSVYRDATPPNTPLPYVLVHEGISVVPEPVFGAFDDTEGHVRELVQVSVWQLWRNGRTGEIEESYTIPDAIARALNGTRLPAAPTHVSGMRVVDMRRLVGNPASTAVGATTAADEGKVHHAITVEVHRTLTPV